MVFATVNPIPYVTSSSGPIDVQINDFALELWPIIANKIMILTIHFSIYDSFS